MELWEALLALLIECGQILTRMKFGNVTGGVAALRRRRKLKITLQMDFSSRLVHICVRF